MVWGVCGIDLVEGGGGVKGERDIKIRDFGGFFTTWGNTFRSVGMALRCHLLSTNDPEPYLINTL